MGFLLPPPWHSGDGSTPGNCQSIMCNYTLRKELVTKVSLVCQSVPVKYCSALSSLELITHICHKVLGCDLGGFYLIHYVQKYLHVRVEPWGYHCYFKVIHDCVFRAVICACDVVWVWLFVSLLILQQRINQIQRFRIRLWLTLCFLLCMWCHVGVAIFLLILQQRINWLQRLKSICGWCVTDLSKNRLSEMPVEVCEYSNMERLNCYHNIIKSIPEAIVQLQALTHLNLRFVPRQPPPFILLCLQSSSSLSVS